MRGDKCSKYEARVEQLLSEMTLEEKVGQMIQINIDRLDQEEMEGRIRRGQAGSVLSFMGHARSITCSASPAKSRDSASR